ncbi:MAG: DNA-processing protein DprA, partial [Anaerolineales bacterium]|nr:DNA-processing protein DprA [Anaerolineales bacterium]
MSTTYVIVDVETTGLDSQRDAIIEVAAITLRDHDILDEFTSLVNPYREIPAFISSMTGISNDMVADAPTMFTVRSRLRGMLSDHVVVGHNVDFDLGFLNEERLGVGNQRIDTLTLASILVPEAGRYDLESLVYHLNLPDPHNGQTHRAHDDAEQTVELFLALRERALALEMWQLEEIVQAGRRIAWPETLFFEDVLAEKARSAFSDGRSRPAGQRLPDLFHPEKPTGQIPVPQEKPEMLEVDLLAGMLEPGGHFEQLFPDFEYRPQQVEMMTAVAEAFNLGTHTLVEAGTGTGKSMAYLLPAAFWAVQNGRRVVVSTNTINLQDQLINKDLPELRRVLPFELRAAIRKGRSNYLCTRLFQQVRHNGPSSADDMTLYARILLWLPHSQTGDVGEIVLRTPGERQAWSRLNGENKVCTAEHCAQARCPLHIARMRAEQAHIVIVNHSLLLADMASENHILPAFVDLIVDEAHHLEAAVTDGLSFRADKRFLEAVLDDITKPNTSLFGQVQTRLRSRLPRELYTPLETYIEGMRREAQDAAFRLDDFFATLGYFLKDYVNRRSQFAEQIRLTTAVRAQPDYSEVEIAWDNLNKHLKNLVTGFGKLAEGLGEAGFAVVSGLARGIDAAAHLAALPTGTVAVMAGGADHISPAENTPLADEIARKGLRLSEQPMGLQPMARHFPLRNRIISGLARAVVVVEAAARSGSLITARTALDQGREVLAVPGHPFDARASGCNMLIRDGATLVRGIEDVLEVLAGDRQAPPAQDDLFAPPPVEAPAPPRQRDMGALHRAILDRLGPSP